MDDLRELEQKLKIFESQYQDYVDQGLAFTEYILLTENHQDLVKRMTSCQDLITNQVKSSLGRAPTTDDLLRSNLAEVDKSLLTRLVNLVAQSPDAMAFLQAEQIENPWSSAFLAAAIFESSAEYCLHINNSWKMIKGALEGSDIEARLPKKNIETDISSTIQATRSYFALKSALMDLSLIKLDIGQDIPKTASKYLIIKQGDELFFYNQATKEKQNIEGRDDLKNFLDRQNLNQCIHSSFSEFESGYPPSASPSEQDSVTPPKQDISVFLDKDDRKLYQRIKIAEHEFKMQMDDVIKKTREIEEKYFSRPEVGDDEIRAIYSEKPFFSLIFQSWISSIMNLFTPKDLNKALDLYQDFYAELEPTRTMVTEALNRYHFNMGRLFHAVTDVAKPVDEIDKEFVHKTKNYFEVLTDNIDLYTKPIQDKITEFEEKIKELKQTLEHTPDLVQEQKEAIQGTVDFITQEIGKEKTKLSSFEKIKQPGFFLDKEDEPGLKELMGDSCENIAGLRAYLNFMSLNTFRLEIVEPFQQQMARLEHQLSQCNSEIVELRSQRQALIDEKYNLRVKYDDPSHVSEREDLKLKISKIDMGIDVLTTQIQEIKVKTDELQTKLDSLIKFQDSWGRKRPWSLSDLPEEIRAIPAAKDLPIEILQQAFTHFQEHPVTQLLVELTHSGELRELPEEIQDIFIPESRPYTAYPGLTTRVFAETKRRLPPSPSSSVSSETLSDGLSPRSEDEEDQASNAHHL